MAYALDTNIIIRYLRKELTVWQNFNDAVTQGYEIVIPQMVDYEIRRGFCIAPTPKKEASYKILKEKCNVIEIDTFSWERAVKIYADLYHIGFTVGEIDILIAALCIENDYILVTNNASDFKNINDIKLVDWTLE
jgi:predicted nucleic acid-binding protein